MILNCALDVKSLETDVAKLDEECSPPKNGDGESEAEAATSPESSRSPDAEPKSAEKQEPQWKGLGFMRKLTLKGPTLPQLPSFARMSKRRFSRDEEMPKIPTNLEAELYYCFQNSWTNFTLSELKEGTDNFNRGMPASMICLKTFRLLLHAHCSCIEMLVFGQKT